MLSIYLKEIKTFFNSIIAYLVIIVFLTVLGIILWVLPNNLLDLGLANLEPLFIWTPFVFLFLVPAVTMKSFAEEKKTGTLELLLTRPINDWQLILGKYLACLTLVLLAVIPTIVYYFTLYKLGNPIGNIDTAGVIGSYIGLFFLAGGYTAIGVFSSSITSNQIVSFIVGLVLSVTFFFGFDALASVNNYSDFAFVTRQFGMNYHYESLSRGVIDTRNLLYFLSLIGIMLGATRLVLKSRMWS